MEIKGKLKSTSVDTIHRERIGVRFSHDWGSGSLGSWIDTTPNVTPTFGGSSTTFVGGSNNLNNYITLPFNTAVENWTVTQIIKPNTKTATSYGVGIRTLPPTNSTSGNFAHFRLADNEGWIALDRTGFASTGSAINNSATTDFQWDAGDEIEIKVQRIRRTMIATMTNLENKMSITISDPAVDAWPGAFQIHFFGADIEFLGDFVLTYEDIQFPDAVAVGDSITYGAFAFSENSNWVQQVGYNLPNGIVSVAASGSASINGTHTITDIVDWIKPKLVIIAHGVNDSNGSVDVSVYETRIRTMLDAFVTAGIDAVLVTPVPQVLSNVTLYATVLSDLAVEYGFPLADVTSRLKNSGNNQMQTIYDYGDGIHPNPMGMYTMASIIDNTVKSLFTESFPFNEPYVPTGPIPPFNLGIDAYGRKVKYREDSSLSYIRNRGEAALTAVQPMQRASAYFMSLWLNDELSVGDSPQSGGYFRVNTSGLTTAVLFTSRNLSTSAAGTAFAGLNVEFSNAAFIRSLQQPLEIRTSHPTTSGVGLRITNGTENATPSNYKPLQIQVNEGSGLVEQAYIDRLGQISLNGGVRLPGSTSGVLTLVAPATITTYTLTLPDNDGSNTQALITNGSGVTSWGPEVVRGTWTPTLTGVTNIATTTPYQGQYIRIGDVVTASVKIGFQATTETLPTELRFSLPIASNFSTDSQLSGTGAIRGYDRLAAIYSDATNNEAMTIFNTPTDGGPDLDLYVQFTYQII